MSWIKKYVRCYQKGGNTVVMLDYTIYITGILDLTAIVSYDYLGIPQTITGVVNGRTIQIPATGVSNLVISAPDVLGYIKTITNESNVYTVSYVVDIYNGHDYVEIGGIKWATMNVGATAATDTGLYFQWGDIQGYTAAQVGSGSGKKYFSWTDYKYGNGTTAMTKYNSTDGKTVLEASDDAVTAAWGGAWRMPTKDEYVALRNAVDTAWTADYQGSGVSGLVLTSKADNSKKLFFPAAGHCRTGSVSSVGSYGRYWSSSVFIAGAADVRSAYRLYFGSSYENWQANDDRYYGFAVRGVVSA